MTARADVLGKTPSGQVRRYGAEPAAKLLHVLTTPTGRTAYCGVTVRNRMAVPEARTRKIEARTDAENKGFSLCRDCYRKMASQPDPAIWKNVVRP